jgi:hypothetical protein
LCFSGCKCEELKTQKDDVQNGFKNIQISGNKKINVSESKILNPIYTKKNY